VDMHVKGALVRDLLQLDDPLDFDRRALLQVREETNQGGEQMGWHVIRRVGGWCPAVTGASAEG